MALLLSAALLEEGAEVDLACAGIGVDLDLGRKALRREGSEEKEIPSS